MILKSATFNSPTDIVITDPCYYEHVQPLLENSTLYGDWSCKVWWLKESCDISDITPNVLGDIIGRFCADSGRVAIFRATDITEFPEHASWTTTVVPNFVGVVNIVNIDNEIYVHGVGKPNTPSFITRQTGF